MLIVMSHVEGILLYFTQQDKALQKNRDDLISKILGDVPLTGD